jgi:molybdopterin synthase sulfur carrier subunit
VSTSVTVRYFAALREVVGRAQERVAIEAMPPTLSALLGILVARHPAAAPALQSPRVRVARNQVFASGDCALADGDEIAFLPPVTGG